MQRLRSYNIAFDLSADWKEQQRGRDLQAQRGVHLPLPHPPRERQGNLGLLNLSTMMSPNYAF